jgi:type IV pilus assembly protein PilW
MNPARKQTNPLMRHSRGFSMVELMIAMVITLILLGGIAQIFQSSKKSFTIQDSLGRQQENGRYATDIISTDIRRAGYWGGNADVSGVIGSESRVAPAASCNTGDNTWARMIERRIFGLNHTQTTEIGNYNCVNDGNGYTRGDILALRFASPWVMDGSPADTRTIKNNSRLYIRSSLSISDKAGRMFKGSDKDDTENQMSSGGTLVTERDSELIVHAYYIGPSGQTCNGAQVPSLFREILDDNGQPIAQEVAYGVDELQVQYGLDSDGDNSVDTYLDAGDAGLITNADWSTVIAARFWLLTRAECPETGYTNSNTYTMGDRVYQPNDDYRRQLYTSTIRLRNL